MLNLFKTLFENKCPHCNEKLHVSSDPLCATKTCSQCNYKEESYGSLGVRIVYDTTK
ncbi:hypothetical protein PIL02S_05798 [Paenibacillus illinoisensis]|uniref:Uncharacterized protein n=1 Tax=Paenibacillus illinoisensis TaxID=59845 RepID=A0A2W0C209_9BACL|nr:hypothetical protein PIL02S_05798 [Paenibacillus illinoisensis]